ncbi:MAG: DEAD/DEAH box helicase [Candidatus Hydrogenedentota bacterium]
MNFQELNIDPRCLRILKAQHITEPTPVQAQAIPIAIKGRDLVGIAQTGTGKTLAFALPALARLANGKTSGTSMLVLTPTRELAQQVHAVLEPLARSMGMRTACIFGGVGFDAQTKALRNGCPIIVATPGRLLDHIGRRNARFENLSVLVVDEADRMLDMGFLPDIKRILAVLPKKRQTLMFSATFPKSIEHLAAEMLHEPARIQVAASATPADAVRQGIYTVEHGRKFGLLSKILNQPEVESALVFLRTKHRTDRTARALQKAGFKVKAIHGGRSQSQRDRAIEGFRKGRFQILVATDVAARGLDVEGISHVVNFDIPKNSDDYIHRIGRTARANASGDAITFVCPNEFMALNEIETALGKNLPRKDWEGAVPVVSLFGKKTERPLKNKRRGVRNGRRRKLMTAR